MHININIRVLYLLRIVPAIARHWLNSQEMYNNNESQNESENKREQEKSYFFPEVDAT